MLLTLCGLTGQKTHREGLGLGGLVHEEAHYLLNEHSLHQLIGSIQIAVKNNVH